MSKPVTILELLSKAYKGGKISTRDQKAIVDAYGRALTMKKILEDFIKVNRANFFHSQKMGDTPLHLLTNPPYGERLEGDINELYKNFGDTLKRSYPNTKAWMISSNFEALKFIGLRPSRKIKLFNGKLETRLCFFPIYEGTKKIHKLKNKDDKPSKN